MAVTSTKEIFRNAVINASDWSITEYGRDFSTTYSLLDILKEWDGIEGVNLTIECRTDIVSREEEDS